MVAFHIVVHGNDSCFSYCERNLKPRLNVHDINMLANCYSVESVCFFPFFFFFDVCYSPVIMCVYIKCFGYDSGTVMEHSVHNVSSVMIWLDGTCVRICRGVVPRVALPLLLVLNCIHNPFFL